VSRVAKIFLVQHTKPGKITINYTKLPQNTPNGRKKDQMAIIIYQHLPLQATPKFTQIDIFGLKIYHLANLNVS
jgi:hypothetical protein